MSAMALYCAPTAAAADAFGGAPCIRGENPFIRLARKRRAQ
jgi:hypothetical protein